MRCPAHVLAALALGLSPALCAQTPGPVPPPDPQAYDARMRALANGDASGRWPAQAPAPLAGAVLPFKRIVAYYGNLYSTHMGILGEIPKDEMIRKLLAECRAWELADPGTPVVPSLHYIAVTAQASPGSDGLYRARMPGSEIQKVIQWAREIQSLAFVDIQPGLSTLQQELPHLQEHLAQPDVHLGIDAEFSMRDGRKPGSVIGTLDAADINFAIEHLAQLVRLHKLPPKVLVVHRFTEGMITNHREIKPVPEVQVVMSMDGFGSKVLKHQTYTAYIEKEPVQFAGFKLFYKNDKPVMYTPAELLELTPRPVYIQYQ
jgi:hypothetical protein